MSLGTRLRYLLLNGQAVWRLNRPMLIFWIGVALFGVAVLLQVREGRDHGGGQRCRDTPRRAYPVTTVTDPIDIDPCPYCGTSDGIQQTSDQRLHGDATHFLEDLG